MESQLYSIHTGPDGPIRFPTTNLTREYTRVSQNTKVKTGVSSRLCQQAVHAQKTSLPEVFTSGLLHLPITKHSSARLLHCLHSAPLRSTRQAHPTRVFKITVLCAVSGGTYEWRVWAIVLVLRMGVRWGLVGGARTVCLVVCLLEFHGLETSMVTSERGNWLVTVHRHGDFTVLPHWDIRPLANVNSHIILALS